ncbi:hypothetical protein FSP39_011114 [Pinctada imbricata]|uniref:Uncharacterized protein n=1 Tax=Pinctada imbricata TaxID=66713 RepID=A0AA89CAS8_PINIB|nr:hypothetical protein FSP39_011114 [Pinctada imbricata]
MHEYLDDPLADNNEDAVKLRYAVGRAARKRSFRTRPYDNRRRGGSFSANDFFRGFSNTFTTPRVPQSQSIIKGGSLIRGLESWQDSSSPETVVATTAGRQATSCVTAHSLRPNPSPYCPVPLQLPQISSSEVEYDFDHDEDSFDYEKSQKNVSVKSKLRQNVEFWQNELKANNSILSTIKFGYVIPFAQFPPAVILKNNRSSLNYPDFVCTAINELLSAGCINEVSVPYVVNPLTVSVNSSGKKRLVLDLRHVYRFVQKQKIKFEGIKEALTYAKKGLFMIKFD